MVRGLDIFREHFAAFRDRYVLIGGTASFLALDEIGAEFRATKDLDLVLCIEAFDAQFARALWAFIETGGYQIQQRSSGARTFYRFQKPSNTNYPHMLELFSRAPDVISLKSNATLTPIPVGEDVDSLSAILLEEDYYRLIHDGKREIAGLSCVNPRHLIPLKAHAWLDLTRRAEAGAQIDSRDIKKHRNDVVRLYRLLSRTEVISLPNTVKNHLRAFVDRLEGQADFDPGSVGVKDVGLADIVKDLRFVYGLT